MNQERLEALFIFVFLLLVAIALLLGSIEQMDPM